MAEIKKERTTFNSAVRAKQKDGGITPGITAFEKENKTDFEKRFEEQTERMVEKAQTMKNAEAQFDDIVSKNKEVERNASGYMSATGKNKPDIVSRWEKQTAKMSLLKTKDDYADYLKNNNGAKVGNINVRKDVEWKNNVVKQTGSASWEDFLSKLNEGDETYIESIDTSEMTEVGKKYVNQMKSAVEARKKLVKSMDEYDGYKESTDFLGGVAELKTTDGKSYGYVSGKAIDAIRGNTLENYRPISDSESEVLSEYERETTGYTVSELKKRIEELEKIPAEKYVYDDKNTPELEAVALSRVYSADEIAEIKKNTEKANKKKITDTYSIWDTAFDLVSEPISFLGGSDSYLKNSERIAERKEDSDEAKKKASEREDTVSSAANMAAREKTEKVKDNADWEENSTLTQIEQYASPLADGVSTPEGKFIAGKLYSYSSDENKYLDYLTDDEKKVMIYLIKKNRKDEAREYFDAIKDDVLQERSEQRAAETRRFATNHPILANVGMLVESPLQGLKDARYVVEDKWNEITGNSYGNFDANDERFDYERDREIIAEVTNEKTDNPVGKFMCDVVLSSLENVLRSGSATLAGGLIGGPEGAAIGAKASLALMGTKVYQSGVYDATKRGASKEAAVWYGLTSAGVEIMTEKIGIDNLLNVMDDAVLHGSKAVIKNLPKQMAAEGAEEFISGVLEPIYDDMIMGENSHFNIRVRELCDAGMKKEEARKQAFIEECGDVLSGTAAGALSGGILSIGGTIVPSLNMKMQGEKIVKDGKVESVIADGLKQPENTLQYRLAKELDEKTKKNAKLTDVEVGRLDYVNHIDLIEEGDVDTENITEDVMEDEEENEAAPVESENEAENTGAKMAAPGNIETLKKATDVVIETIGNGAWSEEKENAYKNAVKDLETLKKNADSTEYRAAVEECVSKLNDSYVSANYGTVMSIESAIEKSNEKIKALQAQRSGGKLLEAVTDIDEQIRKSITKRADLEQIKKLTKAGFSVKFFASSDSGVNGATIGKDVYVNLDGEKSIKHTIGHEFVHMLKKNNEASYESYVEAVKKTIADETRGELYEKYSERYDEVYPDWSEETFWEEYASDVAGDLAEDVTFGKNLIEAIAKENIGADVKKNRLRAIEETLRGLITKIRVAWRKKTGQFGVGEAAIYEKNLMEVHRELLRAYSALTVDNASVNDIMESRSGGSGNEISEDAVLFDRNGIRLTKREYAQVTSAISTDYYNKNKKHNGLCWQYCIYNDSDFYYLYYDKGFGEYKFVGRIGGNHGDMVTLLEEGNFYEIAERYSKKDYSGVSEEKYRGRRGDNSFDGIKDGRTVENDVNISGRNDSTGKSNIGEDDGYSLRDDGTENTSIKFSLSDNVEETKNLVAVHNLNEEKLNKAFELGGFAMPSIAIVKSDSGHNEFGDISVVFGKESIDPSNDKNKVYSSDAWTPTFPRVEYKPNDKKISELRDLYYDLSRRFGYNETRSLYEFTNEENATDVLNRYGGEEKTKDALKNDTNLMQLFFLMNGEEKVEDVEKKITSRISEADKERNEYLIEKLGEKFFLDSKTPAGTSPFGYRKSYYNAHSNEIQGAYKDLLGEVYGFNDVQVGNVMSAADAKSYMDLIRECREYIENGGVSVKTEIDYEATKKAVIQKAKTMNYDEWVDEAFGGIAEKKGIANGKDILDKNGNRKSFEALHYEYSLDNIVRAMREAGSQGIGAWGGTNIIGAAATQFESIDEIKNAGEMRLSTVSEEEHEKTKQSFNDRLWNIAKSAVKNKDDARAIEAAANVLGEAVVNRKSKTGIEKYIEKEFSGWANYSENVVDELIDLVNDIRSMPVSYFEAKPERALEFSEVRKILLPSDASEQIKEKIHSLGMEYAEYESGNEEDRKEKLNEIPDIRFSLSENKKASEGETKGENIFVPDENDEEVFSTQIDEWMKGKMPKRGVFAIGKTPEVLKAVGAKDLTIVMNPSVLAKITGEKHDVSIADIKNIPKLIADPVMIFKSATVNNAVVILTDATDKNGNEIIVAMHFDKKEKRIKVNRVASVYGKNNIKNFVNIQIENGNLKYIDKNKSLSWSHIRGLQLPKMADTTRGFNNSILTKDDFVNREKMSDSVKFSLSENKKASEEETNVVPYTEHEKKNWENSSTIVVYENDEQFNEFVSDALNNRNANKKMYFGKIPTDVSDMVMNKTGVDIRDYNIALKGYEIRKILMYSHGNELFEAERGQEVVIVEDLKKIPLIITKPDNVLLDSKLYEGKPVLKFEKTINGKTFVVAYVSRKHHDITVQTMYKRKRSLATAEDVKSPSLTSETTSSTASSNDSILQNESLVNREKMSDSVKFSKGEKTTKQTFEEEVKETEKDILEKLEDRLGKQISARTKKAVREYVTNRAIEKLGNGERTEESLTKLMEQIDNEAVYEDEVEDDGFLEHLKGVEKVYVSKDARADVTVGELSRTFGVGRWSGKEGLPVDVLYDEMVQSGISLPKADAIQDKLIAIIDKKEVVSNKRRVRLPRDEVRGIVEYAVDLSDYKTSGTSEDRVIPNKSVVGRSAIVEGFKTKRRELSEKMEKLGDEDLDEKLRLKSEKEAIEDDFVAGWIKDGKTKNIRDVTMDFCTMEEADEAIARARLKRTSDAAAEAEQYAKENKMTQGMKSVAKEMARGFVTEDEINIKYRNAADRVKIKELSELYKRMTYTKADLKKEQRDTMYEVCDILMRNSEYMRDITSMHGQIDSFENIVDYICRVDSLKDSAWSKEIPEDVRKKLLKDAERLNEVFFNPIQKNTEAMNAWKKRYMEKLSEIGIEKRSAESAAAQALGENFYNKDDLYRAKFSEKQIEKIEELAKFLKEMYKEILPKINEVRFSQGEEDIQNPKFKVNRQLKSIITKMHRDVQFLKRNEKTVKNLSESQIEDYAKRNDLSINAMKAFRAYPIGEFEKHIDWRSEQSTKSMGDMAQWAWNLLESGKAYDRKKGTIEMDYFPHMEKSDAQNEILQLLNLKKTIDKLPTAISGMTEMFRPNKKWSAFMQERLGNETEFDAATGAERYLDSMGKYLYHASDITKIRILENFVREKYSKSGADKFQLSNFAKYLREYGNNLAGKQHIIDRAFQDTFVGRRMAQWYRMVMNNVSRNQLAGNISTAMSNAALYGQGVSWVIREAVYAEDASYLAKIFNTGMDKREEHIAKSTFLSNRFSDDIRLKDKCRFYNSIAFVNEKLFAPAQIVDKVIATRVHQMMTAVYISKGMSEADAIENADVELRRLAASREYGESPLLFSSKTLGVMTKYTLEPLNQMRYYKNQFGRLTKAVLTGDDDRLKAGLKEATELMVTLAADMLIMHLVNWGFKKVKGYPVVTDPIQMGMDAFDSLKEGDVSRAWLDALDEVPIVSNIMKASQGEVTDLVMIGDLINFVSSLCTMTSSDADWGEIAYHAGMIINPFGGVAQIKKMCQAIVYLKKGYWEKNGNVQYATDSNAWDWTVGILFGKSAIPSVQEYYNNGYEKLSKNNSDAFKTILDLYPIEPEELFDMMTEYQELVKEAKKENETYELHTWITEELDKWKKDDGNWDVYDKYYIWNIMKGRKCDVPERFNEAERKIAEAFIETGDTSVLIDEMSDSFSISGYGVTTVYQLGEEDVLSLQGEYEKILSSKIMKDYKAIRNSGGMSAERWVECIKNAKKKSSDEAKKAAVANGWYEDKTEEIIENADYFAIMHSDIQEGKMSEVEAFYLYLDAKGKDYVMPDWQNATEAQEKLAKIFVSCEEEPEDFLPTNKTNTFNNDKKTYVLNEEQHEKLKKLYLDYYWEQIANMPEMPLDDTLAYVKKVRKAASEYAKSCILSEYGDVLVIRE